MATLRQLEAELNRLKQKCCCVNGLPETSGQPEGEPVNGRNVMIDPVTGIIWYWDGDSWEVYVNGVTAPINATDIADGSVTNIEFQHINTLTGNVQNQLNNKSSIGHTHLAGDITDLPILSGVYAPVVSSSSNTDTVNALDAVYHRVGDMVTVTGALEIDVTTAGAAEEVLIFLNPPIPSNLATPQEAVGTGAVFTNTGLPNNDVIIIVASVGEIRFKIISPVDDTTLNTYYYHYTYWIS